MTRPFLSGGRDERILVVRTRYVGDTVMAIPFLRNLRTRYPEARIEVLVEKVSGAVLADCPYHDGLVAWDLPRPGHRLAPVLLTNQFRLAACLRERHYTRAYVLKRALSSILPVWLAGIPHRVGFAGGGRAAFLSRAVSIPPHRHEVELFLDLLRADGIAIDDRSELPDGSLLEGLAGIDRHLAREEGFERSLTRRLLVYALGRGTAEADDELVERLAADLRRDGRFATLVEGIVRSDAFRCRTDFPKPTPR